MINPTLELWGTLELFWALLKSLSVWEKGAKFDLVHYESLEGCMNEKKIEKSKKKEVVCIELQKRKLKKKRERKVGNKREREQSLLV